MNHPDETVLSQLEKVYREGITSAKLLEVFEELGVRFSEASLRKYVQLGLLPRSVRVGRKGKHRGSTGVYPVSVIRQVLRIKEMMAQNFTIEQIQRDFLFVRTDLRQLELTLDGVFATLSAVMNQRGAGARALGVERDIAGARSIGKELLHRLSTIESRLVMSSQLSRLPSAS